MKFTDVKKAGHRKFQCLRNLFMDLVNPVTKKHLLEAIIPVPSKPGRIQLMFLPKGNNEELISKITVHLAGFWWEYMRLVLGFTVNCAKSDMDSFEVESRMGAPHCSLDVDTWEIENELKETRARFGEAMDEAMSDVKEAEIVTHGISFNGGAKAELLATMRVKDDIEFGGGDCVSCASDVTGSVGYSTNRSVNSKRMAVAKETNKQLQDKYTESEKTGVEQEEEMKIMQERLQSMKASITNQSSAGLQGTPHLSGSSTPGEIPLHQEEDGVCCGAGEG